MKSNKITTLTVQLTMAITAVIVVLFETEVLPMGYLTAYSSTDFILCMLMVIITLAVMPASFMLFKQNKHRRGFMLAPVIISNAVLYYLTVNVSYLYMALITLLCLFANWNNGDKSAEHNTEEKHTEVHLTEEEKKDKPDTTNKE